MHRRIIGRRSRSHVPAQSLTLMNDPFVQGEALRWAEAELAVEAAPAERVERLWRRALSRPPTDAERDDCLAFLAEQGARHGVDGDGWTTDPRPWAGPIASG